MTNPIAAFLLTCAMLALTLSATAHTHGPARVGAPAGIAAFDLYTDGTRLHLLLADVRESGRSPTLLYRHSRDGGKSWSSPMPVSTGPAPVYPHGRGNDPQVAAYEGRILAVWTTRAAGAGGSETLAAAISTDEGRTWHTVPPPADARSTRGEGYADLSGGVHGFDLVWLDSRDGTEGVRHARLAADAKRWSGNVTVEKATCECCWNTLAQGSEALYVLFRGRSPRDMFVSARSHGARTWAPPRVVGAFEWRFKACPHTGGGLAYGGGKTGTLHAVVWTGARNAEGLHYLRSSDGGLTWRVPHPFGSTDARRADIAVADDQTVTVVWDQLEGKGRAIYAMSSRDGGERWQKPARISVPAADAMYPRIAASGADFFIAWTERAGNRSVLRTHLHSATTAVDTQGQR